MHPRLPSGQPATDRASQPALTPQELAVARLVMTGMTNRQAAAELLLSVKTIQVPHRQRLHQARGRTH